VAFGRPHRAETPLRTEGTHPTDLGEQELRGGSLVGFARRAVYVTDVDRLVGRERKYPPVLRGNSGIGETVDYLDYEAHSLVELARN
jgi:hypothetical protein